MRRLVPLAITILCAAVGSLFAQGKVSFNLGSVVPLPLVTNAVTGDALDSQYRAQLFYGNTPDASTFSPVWSTPNGTVSTPYTFRAVPGAINDGIPKYTDPAKVDGGQTGYFQVRAWSAALGIDYETALSNWISQPADASRLLGKSIVIRMDSVAAFASSPPTIPLPLAGMQSFGVGMSEGAFIATVPEPSSVALGVLGLAVILWRQRRHSPAGR